MGELDTEFEASRMVDAIAALERLGGELTLLKQQDELDHTTRLDLQRRVAGADDCITQLEESLPAASTSAAPAMRRQIAEWRTYKFNAIGELNRLDYAIAQRALRRAELTEQFDGWQHRHDLARDRIAAGAPA